jgi:hypothetical protein
MASLRILAGFGDKAENSIMRLLKSRWIVGLVFLVPACNQSPSEPPVVVQPYVAGATTVHSSRYVVTITKETLKKTPSWDENNGNPPLSAKKAMKAANWMKESLVKGDKDYEWRFDSCQLTPGGDDKWYWVVRYDALPQFSGGGVFPVLKVVVLMDGSVIQLEERDAE